MKLSDTFVKRKQGNGKVQKHSDGGGLYLYISPEGKKSWRMGYRFLGKQKLLVIGPYPGISLKDARDKRHEARKLLSENIDPSAAKQEAKQALMQASEVPLKSSLWSGLKSRAPPVPPSTAALF